jgi:hypothetical protein
MISPWRGLESVVFVVFVGRMMPRLFSQAVPPLVINRLVLAGQHQSVDHVRWTLDPAPHR